MTIWQLLKDYVHDFEIANDGEFSDDAWQRIKQLERDIYAAIREETTTPNTELVEAIERLQPDISPNVPANIHYAYMSGHNNAIAKVLELIEQVKR